MSHLSMFDSWESDDATATGRERFLSVSELTAQVKSTLEGRFANVALRGEISNLARPRSGHVYLSLKDENAQVRAVIWKSVAEQLPFEIEDGLAVRVWGKLTVYPPRGEYQLSIRRLEPEGLGALELAFRQTFERLKAEGLFDAERKKPIPRFPRRIVIVTSPSGAVVRDFLQVTGRRWPATEILVAPTLVQGPGAALQVAAAIALANQVTGVDVIVVARGGGSLEDLWAFNEEPVARAIFASRVPVISAIGHETDVTIADFVADLRALTPSEAAEHCVPDLAEVAQRVDLLAGRLARSLHYRLELARDDLERLVDRARRAVMQSVDDRRHRLSRLIGQLEALSPLGVLSRGYSVTLKEDRATLVRQAGDVSPGDRIVTRLAEGEVVSRVEGV